LKITLHDQLKFLSPAEGHQVKYFIEPIIVALNYIEVHHRYSSISMTGISGGAWTTTLAAAIDNRIINSFPVAGSYPIFLRSNSGCDWGDYEQTLPELYTKVNYLDLYILGAYGKQRKQLQILNQFDNCCFAGIRWKTYKDVVRSHIQHLGAGAFDIYMDSSHKKHMISPLAINLIIDEIERE
jgi:hypothetical protein